MKKILSIILLSTFLFLPSGASAIDLGGSLVKKAAVDEAGFAEATETTFAETLGAVVRAALSFVGVIFMILMVYAGYMWMSARGDEEKVTKAQKIIRGAVIGLVITVGANSITSFVVPKILEKTTGDTGSGGGSAAQTATCSWRRVTGGSGSGTPNNNPLTQAECSTFCQANAPATNAECLHGSTVLFTR
jgi:hypothetical protein